MCFCLWHVSSSGGGGGGGGGGRGGGGRRERFESKSSAMTISNEYISGLHRIHTADLLPDLFI